MHRPMGRIINVEQGSPEWLQARAGNVTASKVSDIMATIKSGEAAARRDYRVQLVTEILTGAPVEGGYKSPEMQWGNDMEPLARASYEVFRGVSVDVVGFILHPTLARAGCSPDGLVDWDGGDTVRGIVQFKCPKTSTHLEYCHEGRVPKAYQPQMLWEMACSGAEWCDFVSFDPRLPPHLQLFIRRFHRDAARIEELENAAAKFLDEVVEMAERVGNLTPAIDPDYVPEKNTKEEHYPFATDEPDNFVDDRFAALDL